MGFPLFGLLGLGSLFTEGALSTGMAAASTAKSVYDQINLSDPTLKERALALVPFGAGPKIEKGLGSLFRTGGAGGDGGDGGTGATQGDVDFFGRPFVDPGLGSPAQNIQFGGTGAQAGVGAVTTENLSAPPPAPGGVSEAEFDPSGGFFGSLSSSSDFDPSGGGLGFFNQGGLVSLLPRRATPAHSPPVWRPRY
jgi:hypothetical protein